MTKKYHTVGMGGTFDHFHVGHQHFLEYAAALADTILVGVTIPELTEHKIAANQIEEFEVREAAVKTYLAKKRIKGEVVALHDQFGPTLEANDIDVLVVTEHSVSGAEAINAERQKLGLSVLPVHVCPLLRDDTGECISSTRIRMGQINRDGQRYEVLLSEYRQLSPIQISAFRKPQGDLLSEFDRDELEHETSIISPSIVVGDRATETFLQENWMLSLAVFDRKTTRMPYHSELIESALASASKVVTLPNPAGHITEQVVSWLAKYLPNVAPQEKATPVQIFVEVDGEEDLVTVAAVLLSPLGTTIYYGQPNQGIVKLTVTEQLKTRFLLKLSGDRSARYRSLQPH